MDMGLADGTATLLSMSDGTASLYLSTGGGIIGGGGHESVRCVAAAFVRLAGRQQAHMEITEEFPLPSAGRIAFYVLTDSGVFTGEADEATLVEKTHTFSPLFYAGHDVLTQLRLISGAAEW
jgi:hypothetical protein